VVVRRAWKEIQDEDEIARLRAELAGARSFHGIHARDRRMLAVLDAIRRIAPTSAAVLLWGESGTGKELVARAIHAESPRARGPFVAFNAAALPDTLAEAELFGVRKGAFTGADRDRKGLFCEADGGTLFIDEASSMPASLQGKLLRALQESEVLPVGSSTPVKVSVRIVAATNVEPSRLLRERVEDIPLLAQVFLERSQGQVARISPRALRLLVGHDWPGNVRELQNVLERAAAMARGEELGPADIVLEDDDLDWQPEGEEGLAYEEARRRALERFQRRYVERAMAGSGGNLAAAARRAGITRAALHRIVKRLGRDVPDEDPPAAPAGGR
jgi:DNA-binding NtrC family response regulator